MNLFESLQNNNITPVIDKLAISIFNETKTHNGPDFVNTTKKLFIDNLDKINYQLERENFNFWVGDNDFLTKHYLTIMCEHFLENSH